MMNKTIIALIVLTGIGGHQPAVSAELIQDPIQHFYSGLHKEDMLVVFEADLNEDGRNEVFLSTNSESSFNAKAGRLWDLYISVEGGYIAAWEMGGDVPNFNAPGGLVRLNNGRLAILRFFPSSARAGSITVFYLDADNVPIEEKIDEIAAEPGEFNERYSEVVGAHATAAPEAKVISRFMELDEVYSPAQIAALESEKDPFWDDHYDSVDPDDPNADLVYRKSDDKLVGRTKWGVLTLIEEPETDEPETATEPVAQPQDALEPVPSVTGAQSGENTSGAVKANIRPVAGIAVGLLALFLLSVILIRRRRK